MNASSSILKRKEHALQRRDHSLVEREELYARKEQELATLLATQMHTLEQIAHMTTAEAKQQLMDRMLSDARAEAAEKLRRTEEEAKELARKRASVFIRVWRSNALLLTTWWKARSLS